MSDIIWKQIHNFSRYEASSSGEIRSLNYKNSGKIKILKPGISDDGYLGTMLKRDDGKYMTVKVHRVVAETFIGPKITGLEVNHIDGNKLNNMPDNLEYVTRSENMIHAYKSGLAKPLRGSDVKSSKLLESDVREIRAHAAGKRYYGRKELAIKYGISEAHIKDIVTRRRGVWSHV